MHFPLHIAALMYVLTGGPSVGKTSILKELEKQGESTVREAATDWIASRLACGVAEFWKEPNMELNILSLQLKRERPFWSAEGRVFIDRGIFDPFAYVPLMAPFGPVTGDDELVLMNQAVQGIDLNHHYAAIFLILPYNTEDFIFAKDEIRRENELEFHQIHSALYAIYCRHKNFIIVPGDLTPAERASFILESIKKIENQSS